jgi:hypothetical protein
MPSRGRTNIGSHFWNSMKYYCISYTRLWYRRSRFPTKFGQEFDSASYL